MANCSTGPRTAGSVTASSFCESQRSNRASGSSRAARIPACSSRLRRWLAALSVPASSRPAWVNGISPLASPVSSSWTLGERFQVRMLAGRSTRHSASTIGGHGVGVVRAVDHQRGQVLAKGAPGTGSAPVEIAFGPATSTGEVCREFPRTTNRSAAELRRWQGREAPRRGRTPGQTPRVRIAA